MAGEYFVYSVFLYTCYHGGGAGSGQPSCSPGTGSQATIAYSHMGHPLP